MARIMIDTNELHDYTDDELLDAWQEAHELINQVNQRFNGEVARRLSMIKAAPEPKAEYTHNLAQDLERWRKHYAEQIDEVQEYVDRVDGRVGAWRTRNDRISCRVIRKATGINGQATVLKIRRAIESMSDRGPVPPPSEKDDMYSRRPRWGSS